jgi:hypothetical protein
MISLGVRLTVAGGREAAARFVIIAAAVAVGAGLLLATVAGVNALNKQTARYAWLNTGVSDTPTSTTAAPLWWETREDYFHGRSIGRIDVAATGDTSPVPPGIPRLPHAGEYYVSPALAALIAGNPADQLADRYPGQQAGIIGDDALPAPDSLIIVVGRTTDDMSHQADAVKVTGIQGITPSSCHSCAIGLRAAGLDLVLGVVAGAMLFPVLMLIGTSTRLSAARREERFAAMRLVGATPRQISMLAAVEAALSAVAGTALGFALFFLLRGRIAAIPFSGDPFFPSDMTLGPLAIVAVAIGIPVAAAAAATVALRRVNISPLGVTRRVTPRPPRAYRLIPIGVGLAELSVFLFRRPEGSLAQTEAFLPGFLIIMSGLVVAGPWFTMVGSRIISRRTGRAAPLIAARRLADNPKAGFRSVSGLILALFVTSVATGVIGTIVYHRGAPTTGPAAYVLGQQLPEGTRTLPAGVLDRLRAIPGVRDAIAVHDGFPDRRTGGTPPVMTGGNLGQFNPDGFVACSVLAGFPDLGRCQPGAQVAAVFDDLVSPDGRLSGPDIVWPTAAATADQLTRLPYLSVAVVTDGSPATLEQARTTLAEALGDFRMASTEAEWRTDSSRLLTQWEQLANVVIVVSLAIAGCSLAVSVVSGLNDRKRPFSVLRLTGVPLGVLRRVVALETVVPLLTAAVIAIAVGLVAANLFLRAQMQYTLRPPGWQYLAIVVAGIVVSLGIIASTFPLLRRVTGPETARND